MTTERKRVNNPRCCRDICPAHGNSDRLIPEETCPDCGGLRGFLIQTEEEMRKIRRWVLLRHQQDVEERQNPIKLGYPQDQSGARKPDPFQGFNFICKGDDGNRKLFQEVR